MFFWIIFVYIIQEFLSRRSCISAQVHISDLNFLTLAFMRSTSWLMVAKQEGSNANYLVWYLVLSFIAYYSTSSTTLNCALETWWSNVIGLICGCDVIPLTGRLVRSFFYILFKYILMLRHASTLMCHVHQHWLLLLEGAEIVRIVVPQRRRILKFVTLTPQSTLLLLEQWARGWSSCRVQIPHLIPAYFLIIDLHVPTRLLRAT